MHAGAKHGRQRLKDQALQFGAHPECLQGRDASCQHCRDIMDALIDRVTPPSFAPDARAAVISPN
jgi:hypothetical protein